MRYSLCGCAACFYRPATYWPEFFGVAAGGVGDDHFCADDRFILNRLILPAHPQAAIAGNFISNRLCNYYAWTCFFEWTNGGYYCAGRGPVYSGSSFY